MASSPRQLLNGQEMLKICEFKFECHGIKFETLNVRSICGRKTEVSKEKRKKKVNKCCTREDEKFKELVL